MTTLPFIASVGRTSAVAGLLFTTVACTASQKTPDAASAVAAATSASTPVLLSCPAGQQPLMRQVQVSGALVPQVECVSAGAVVAPVPVAQPGVQPMVTPVGFAPSPVNPMVPVAAPVQRVVYEDAPVATPARTTSRPTARRAVYDEGDVVEYTRPAKRSWKKSAVIIGSAAGAGAGVGAMTGGKKGALIGAAIGGGAATVWDQVTRRQ